MKTVDNATRLLILSIIAVVGAIVFVILYGKYEEKMKELEDDGKRIAIGGILGGLFAVLTHFFEKAKGLPKVVLSFVNIFAVFYVLHVLSQIGEKAGE